MVESQKTEEIRDIKCVSETSKTLFINGFMQNFFLEGHKMFLQKFQNNIYKGFARFLN